jgi:hypothetical protein
MTISSLTSQASLLNAGPGRGNHLFGYVRQVRPGGKAEWFLIYAVLFAVTTVVCLVARLWWLAALSVGVAALAAVAAARSWGGSEG